MHTIPIVNILRYQLVIDWNDQLHVLFIALQHIRVNGVRLRVRGGLFIACVMYCCSGYMSEVGLLPPLHMAGSTRL